MHGANQLHVTDVYWDLSNMCAGLQYIAQLCTNLASLKECHQFIEQSAVPSSLATPTSSMNGAGPITFALTCAGHQRKHHQGRWWLLTET